MTLQTQNRPAIQTVDNLDRPLKDLRISVIDRCNFRCTYCMPKEEQPGQYSFLKEHQWLTYDEIERLTRIFVQCGASKVRLTGGEPLIRPGLDRLIARLNTIDGIEDLTLTTNGQLLFQQADKLKNAGLGRITVSLDALDENIFHKINGSRGSVDNVLKGIVACERLDFNSIKINAVIQKGVNEDQILKLVRHFKGRRTILRFIEYMDVGNCNHWDLKEVVTAGEIIDRINTQFPIEPLEANYFGEVASRWRFTDGSGELGFISSISRPFCRSCTRARLSPDGKLYTCLFATDGTDLKPVLRAGIPDDGILETVRRIWHNRTDRYSELRISGPPQHPKVEMYQIGG